MGELTLSPRSIRRTVMQRSLKHPVTLVGAVGAVVLGGGALVAGGVAATSLAIGAALVAGVSFAYQSLFARADHVRVHVAAVEAAQDRARMAALGALRGRLFDLAEFGTGANVPSRAAAEKGTGANHAGRALEQYQRLQRGHDAFGALLGRKLNVGEFTYVRYAGSVERAYAVVVDNLRAIADQLHIARADGRDDIDVEPFLAANESAIKALTATAQAVSRMRDLDAVPLDDLDAVIADLDSIAARH